MSDNPTVKRAADVIWRAETSDFLGYSPRDALAAAQALAAAGLLADPTTPPITDEQADVIDAAVFWRNNPRGSTAYAGITLFAAVDRLTAAPPKETP